MTVANDKTLRDLEYARLKQLVKTFADSSLGEAAIEDLAPLDDRASIEKAVDEVKEAQSYLERTGRFSLGGLHDLTPLLQRAKEVSCLDGEAFLPFLQTIEATHRIRSILLVQEDLPLLQTFAQRLSQVEDLAKQIYRAIDENGEIREDASPTLRQLTRKRGTLEVRIERKLRQVIDRNPDLISEPVITRRAGRLVLAIKSGAIGTMEFVVHDRSATGQTLYAEPTSLVSENNAVAGIENELREERLRILRELTTALKQHESTFRRNQLILAHLDSLFARAAYAIAHRCAFPRLSDRIALYEARHPLLSSENVVPISLHLGERCRMMVITGPNTGGKTVTLKTIGLLTLMTQSGIPIPVSPDSEMMIVCKVRSDIGDEQSITQNLSTFSGHMQNVVSLLRQADARTLILLDELGAGTDPQEGAALGLAILEELLKREALVAVSTHLTPLKYFAIQHPAVKTASMEFDAQTLSPTFRLIEGVPGRSNAFVIARNLGLSEVLVERARSLLSHGEVRAEDIIEELQRERQAMLRYRRTAEQELSEAMRQKQMYEERLADFERTKEEEIASRLKEMDTFLRRAQERVEHLLAEMNESASAEEAKAAYRELSGLRGELRDKEAYPSRREGEALPLSSLQVGHLVHLGSLNADGRIVQLASQGKVMIDLEGIRVFTAASDLFPAEGKRDSESHFPLPPRPRAGQVGLQLNVRGMTVAEALREVETYVDRLLLADVRSASILHGKGTGALRDAVRSYLSSCSFVQSCGRASPREGGDGVTLFELAGDED
ncbi:MAG TPA: endonuclease MutS2 [Candidatus Heimdallarchaeota archaeon]|nr:endonuclease MutS2 [Candidatus Heimdallarchaeota archaeon]